MPTIADNIAQIEKGLKQETRLIAVTKTKPEEVLMEAYNAGCKRFGENKVQEMTAKYEALPKDIEWHMIGHLQTNKVKYMAPYVTLVHSVDSFKLLKEINKEAAKNDRIIPCLLQIFIAQEETKFGLSEEEAREIITSPELSDLQNIRIAGLMGMASNTEDEQVVRAEFKGLKTLFESFKSYQNEQVSMQELSMGMSADYTIAMEEGSTLIRVGSSIFGSR
ncbi:MULTISPECIES: YggS family pyridoxal phosphate-dependent enzyme [Dyadobacter]|uniref:Pyridoxal phosphate homeostasis protein n=1 Tax=Dyadobacter chenhuakuii TaxID=2909339 RepID=A0ABY4XR78_9BACT|nr:MULTISPECIES: YggS family pyridoxal phosphate-dependent enzyme [Dyadobacter]MCE7070463.1 YggS family pyridoxal phosphate-dependent enzyme [Dyadobacter sp. CY327]MCF2492760.1 YggS family pyridoxal phosphate-dependent enzyme [Dyadobacter chenhuakuii]MCF2520823.1 YggS family pyridoxal phosphate-dependent enzyme [Dyadobacter sp. CY351]USJ32949.1 YggS family pyridoxal phosphate-dependent enzyme [Dyadobacter chenhuakuii]